MATATQWKEELHPRDEVETEERMKYEWAQAKRAAPPDSLVIMRNLSTDRYHCYGTDAQILRSSLPATQGFKFAAYELDEHLQSLVEQGHKIVIAEKYAGQFEESKHPRDESGKFTNKGGQTEGTKGGQHTGLDFIKNAVNERGMFEDEQGRERGGDWFREEIKALSDEDIQAGIDWTRSGQASPAQQRWIGGALLGEQRARESKKTPKQKAAEFRGGLGERLNGPMPPVAKYASIMKAHDRRLTIEKYAGQFDESKHPRDPEGKFSEKEETSKPLAPAIHTGTGKDYRLTMADGSDLPDHLKTLRLPPAWTDVQINASPDAALVATGTDAKGRRQYVYSAAHSEGKAAAKFSKISELQTKLQQIRTENANTESEESDVLSLIMATGIRPGSDKDTKAEKQAFGATTLQGRHVLQDEQGNVRLRFTGKKGVDIDLAIKDPHVTQMLLRRATGVDPNDSLFNTTDMKLRDHTRRLDGGSFTPKDFRTLKGTQTAAQQVQQNRDCCKDEKQYKKAVREVAKIVAAQLGNTPTIALQSYIDPTVFAAWRPA